MDKNAIKKYAVWAREELIKRVSARAEKCGISKDNMVAGTAETVNGILLTSTEKEQRTKLIEQIKTKGYEQVVEEVAYTWFNRFCALRFMEVNNYLPTHIRVFTDESNKFEPQIMAEAIHLELDGLDKSKVLDLKEKNANDELYKYLLITQCNALSCILPGMFQKISDYTELLFPDNILREGSVIDQMIALIEEENWKDAVQIIGWLYQYYNTQPKAKVFNRPKEEKIHKEDIPAATQLFTPDWIVRYMVENSLGRLWYESHSDNVLKSHWKYYLDEVEQEVEVQAQLKKNREECKLLNPENIKCIDPCMGSGHILVYMFDVLMQIYESYGYNSRDAVASIVEKNLYGLDIDDRAAQLAYFAVMMKARQYDRRFFFRDIQPHIYAIPDYEDWKEYGSLTIIDDMPQRPKTDDAQISLSDLNNDFLNAVVDVAEVLTEKYDVVVTNPPYMTINNVNSKLYDFVMENYFESRPDLYSVFIQKCKDTTKICGYFALVTMHSWMFTTSFEDFRLVMNKATIVNMAHLGTRAFEEISGEKVQTTTFVMQNIELHDYRGVYSRLVKPNSQEGKENLFLEKSQQYSSSYNNYSRIIGNPIAYWVSDALCEAFSSKLLSEFAQCCTGMQTGNNDRYVRLWYEVNLLETTIVNHNGKFKKYNCGGESRKWYGNHKNVVLWSDNGDAIRSEKSSVIRNESYYFKKGITWKRIGGTLFYLRFLPEGFIFDQAGDSMFPRKEEDLNYLLALVNSKVAVAVFEFIAPTMNLTAGNMNKLPIIYSPTVDIDKMVIENISISKADWDSFETSWDFSTHPFILNKYNNSIMETFNCWEQVCKERIHTIKDNEENANEYFINLYGLSNELSNELSFDEITINQANACKDVKSFISYAVGCMFGRYSLDIDGLAYAGGEFDNSKYITYPADKDNIIPICDDEYFDDDIVGRFVSFVQTVYGTETLDENLKFIADAIGGKGQPKDVIRNYFLNDFFADHCKVYQKRPIYWLFDSAGSPGGSKKNGFKALIYMHRYRPDTLARMRTDYVHEQQGRYRTAINDLQHRISDATTAERVKLTKQLAKIQDQDSELRIYEEKIHHLADQMIEIDLDDGVKHNYELFQDVLAKIK